MRTLALCLSLALPLSALAQSPTPGQTTVATTLFESAGDITALIAKAKATRKPDQANFVQPLIQLPPYTVNLEYRVAGLSAPAATHEREAEMFYVVEGSGTAVTGGKLRDERRTNPANLSGSGIDGGTTRSLNKGDLLMVPENTPHWFSPADGSVLILMSLHLPVGK
jgi:mannose-6-phosphate isomerase-like protein (cupin superfamily)